MPELSLGASVGTTHRNLESLSSNFLTCWLSLAKWKLAMLQCFACVLEMNPLAVHLYFLLTLLFSSSEDRDQLKCWTHPPSSITATSSTRGLHCRWEVTNRSFVSPKCTCVGSTSKMAALGLLLHPNRLEKSCMLPWWSFTWKHWKRRRVSMM